MANNELKWSADEIADACVKAGLGILECHSLMVTLKATPPVATPAQGGLSDALSRDVGYESGTLISDPTGLGAEIHLHFVSPAHGEIAFEWITEAIEARILGQQGGGDVARLELDRIKRVASCGTADSFLSLPDEDKRYWFAQCMDESERRKLAEERLAFLHSTNKDAEGWEWGVVRIRNVDGRIEYLWGLSDNSDIDAAIQAQAGDAKGGA